MRIKTLRILQLVDSLAVGGTERMAVQIANALAHTGVSVHVCATRAAGPLASELETNVPFLALQRKQVVDIGAIHRLVRYIDAHKIQIIHAHSSSLLTATLARWLGARVRIIWHDHFGRYATETRAAWLHKPLVHQADSVIAVNRPLVDWTIRQLNIPATRVHYIPNFIDPALFESIQPAKLPAEQGKRIVCVANLRPEKDHFTLLQAAAEIIRRRSDFHLFLVGATGNNGNYAQTVLEQIQRLALQESVTYLGQRTDVPAILKACDVGVLSSRSEGLPVTLLEYGAAGLPVVITDVGQCAEVVNYGDAGILVPPTDTNALSTALIKLLDSTELRQQLGSRLQQRIHQAYSEKLVITQICDLYSTLA